MESYDRKHEYCRSKNVKKETKKYCTHIQDVRVRSRKPIIPNLLTLQPLLTVPLAFMLLRDVRRSNLLCEVTIFKPLDHSYSTLKSLLETRGRDKIEHDDKIERE